MAYSSRLPGFYQKSAEKRLETIVQVADLNSQEQAVLRGDAGLDIAQADHMVENVVGLHGLPVGIATNFLINDRDVLVPMAIEEPSVVAGASFAAKLVRAGGGFTAMSTPPEMIAQIQVVDLANPGAARFDLLLHRQKILDLANESDPVIVNLGGGARDIQVRVIEDKSAGSMLVVHLIYDARDAMGANAVNTAAEAVAPLIEQISGGRVVLRILSNLADRRLARARCVIPADALSFESNGREFQGQDVARKIVEAYRLAAVDPYRAATHNKGIMNGVDAVVIATGNDWRAVEAGAHAYAVKDGRYTSLSTWGQDKDGNLVGSLEMPMAVGTVGGATKVHPTARAALKLMDIHTAADLAQIIVAVGLAQNLAAIRALATEGIQRGHMGLHARQVAIAAGAEGEMIEKLAKQLVEEKTVRIDRAEELLKSWS